MYIKDLHCRNLFITVLLICFIPRLQAQNDKLENWASFNLRGQVRVVYEKMFAATEKRDSIVKNPKGNRDFDLDETPTGYRDDYIVKFNEMGNIIYKKPDSYESNPILFNYNDKGSLIEILEDDIRSYGKDNPQLKDWFKYDAAGKLIEHTIYGYSDMIESRKQYLYDNSGRLKEEIYYTGDGTIDSKVDYVYDARGNLVKIRSHQPKFLTEPSDLVVYSYNEKNQRIKASTTYSGYEKYNSEGQLIESGDNYDNERTTYKYDKYGNLLEKITYQKEKVMEKISYTFKYDEYGNWTQRIGFRNIVPTQIKERKYEYFEEK